VSQAMRVVAVIQARMGSSRLPGKVLQEIAGRPLIEWTLRSVATVAGVEAIVLATTEEPEDDVLAGFGAAIGFPVHRGSSNDVLTRVWEAVAPFDPDIVLRQTGDNPFPDPGVAAAQLDRLIVDEADYVGIRGWPLGIAAEVCRVEALEAAVREANDPAEREHVMPFIYSRPDRFRIGRLPRLRAGPTGSERWRYTVDTEADLDLVRSLADHLGHGPPVRLDELEAVIDHDPELANLNAAVEQRTWRVTEHHGGQDRPREETE
jgi:spore coat polysaccharide biosynthesis protein SpsF (cytidylyltransferase family)